MEEYVEARCFYEFEKNKRLPLKKEIEAEIGDEFKMNYNTYLGGLSDFTGELVRKAVILATKKRIEEVKKLYETVEEIYGALIEFDFRNGETRKKFDSVKYNLAKLENITYELSLRT